MREVGQIEAGALWLPFFVVSFCALLDPEGFAEGSFGTTGGVKCSRNGKEAVERWVDWLSVYGEGA
jgi:hypothetical protein